MKNLIISEDVLNLYKQLINNFCFHTNECSYYDTEVCDCGLRYLKMKLREEVKNIKEV